MVYYVLISLNEEAWIVVKPRSVCSFDQLYVAWFDVFHIYICQLLDGIVPYFEWAFFLCLYFEIGVCSRKLARKNLVCDLLDSAGRHYIGLT